MAVGHQRLPGTAQRFGAETEVRILNTRHRLEVREKTSPEAVQRRPAGLAPSGNALSNRAKPACFLGSFFRFRRMWETEFHDCGSILPFTAAWIFFESDLIIDNFPSDTKRLSSAQ
jgi:hypothetical protein